MTSEVFNAYSNYYDLLYRDKDYEAECDYIQKILTKNKIKNGDILEYGSGTGKHGRIMSSKGYKVHGIELSVEMVNKALQVDGFTCQQGDICEVNMNKQYDAVLSLFHVISYQISNRKLQEVFKRASEHLKPGGIFLFDFWYTPAVNAQKPVVRIKRLANDFIEITRIAEPEIHSNENRVDVNYTIYARDLQSGNVQIMSEKHPMRHFTIPEIDLLASLNGFERIDAEEFLTGKPSGEDTWGVCVSLRKN